MKPTLIFDLDNTLVECGQYYTDASEAFAELQASTTGCPPKFALDLHQVIDVEMAKRPGGFRRDRFPTSFAATSLALDAIQGKAPDSAKAHKSFEIGDSVFTAEYTPYDGAIETLHHYRAGGWQLVLLTKGDKEVQSYKIDRHNLRNFFDHIYITLTKSPEYLGQVLQEVDARPSHTWYMGDSVRDDIGPALKLGIGAVEVATGTGKWGYENAQHVADYVVPNVDAIRKFIPQLAIATTAGHGKNTWSGGARDLPAAA